MTYDVWRSYSNTEVRRLPELLTCNEDGYLVVTILSKIAYILGKTQTFHNESSAACDVTQCSVSVREATSQLLAHLVVRNGGDAGSPNSVDLGVFRCSQY